MDSVGVRYLPSTPTFVYIHRPLQGREGIFAVFLSKSQTVNPGDLVTTASSLNPQSWGWATRFTATECREGWATILSPFQG